MTHRGSGVMAETPPTARARLHQPGTSRSALSRAHWPTGAIGPKASCDPMPKIESREAPCCFLR